MRITAITRLKNDGPFILEWLAYHMLIGIDDFVVFSDASDDCTNPILDRLCKLGIVQHLPNPKSVTDAEDGGHAAMMDYVNCMPRLRRSDWVVCLDVNDFICVNTGQGRLSDLFAAVSDADFISMNQLNFGCNGHENYDPSTLQLQRFDRSMAKSSTAYGWDRARAVKTITRGSASFDRLENHAPRVSCDDLNWVNGNGVPVSAKRYGGGLTSSKGADVGYYLVQVNRYGLRATENYMVKTGGQDWRGDWHKLDDNLVRDTNIQRWAGMTRAGLNSLLQDPELRRLHEASVAWHQGRIEALRGSDLEAGIIQAIRRNHVRKCDQEAQQAAVYSQVVELNAIGATIPKSAPLRHLASRPVTSLERPQRSGSSTG